MIFIIAAFSDMLDGYLARRYKQVSELGQLLDPIADKLLLFATLIPIYWITRHPTILVDYRIPWWGSLPVWVALILVGREVLVTVGRWFALRRGVVIPAGGPGKLKAGVPECLHRRDDRVVCLEGCACRPSLGRMVPQLLGQVPRRRGGDHAARGRGADRVLAHRLHLPVSHACSRAAK